MLGFLIDSEEFEVKPAISRAILMDEIVTENRPSKIIKQSVIDITIVSFKGNGTQIIFTVGEPIGVLFNVTINGLTQRDGVDYFHISNSSRISFSEPPPSNSTIVITYYKGRNPSMTNTNGVILNYNLEYFTYNGSTLTFNTTNPIVSVIFLEINGLIEVKSIDYNISVLGVIELSQPPIIGSVIGVGYLY